MNDRFLPALRNALCGLGSVTLLLLGACAAELPDEPPVDPLIVPSRTSPTEDTPAVGCENPCAAGARECESDAVVRVCERDAQGCSRWQMRACVTGTTCPATIDACLGNLPGPQKEPEPASTCPPSDGCDASTLSVPRCQFNSKTSRQICRKDLSGCHRWATTSACSDGRTCSNGGCVCSGCLVGTECYAGTSAGACGTGGKTCNVCSTGRICVLGTCITPP